MKDERLIAHVHRELSREAFMQQQQLDRELGEAEVAERKVTDGERDVAQADALLALLEYAPRSTVADNLVAVTTRARRSTIDEIRSQRTRAQQLRTSAERTRERLDETTALARFLATAMKAAGADLQDEEGGQDATP